MHPLDSTPERASGTSGGRGPDAAALAGCVICEVSTEAGDCLYRGQDLELGNEVYRAVPGAHLEILPAAG
ncbi:hypothetical protein GCM10023225_18090 [Kineococcus glutinatus]|uniref:Uncharacterized protein n=2 Tax=Kineococcus glutinatus TaxID=1070872 RepID=A0ABP9HU01_9ACTN